LDNILSGPWRKLKWKQNTSYSLKQHKVVREIKVYTLVSVKVPAAGSNKGLMNIPSQALACLEEASVRSTCCKAT
jgi:hypothetical protein